MWASARLLAVLACFALIGGDSTIATHHSASLSASPTPWLRASMNPSAMLQSASPPAAAAAAAASASAGAESRRSGGEPRPVVSPHPLDGARIVRPPDHWQGAHWLPESSPHAEARRLEASNSSTPSATPSETPTVSDTPSNTPTPSTTISTTRTPTPTVSDSPTPSNTATSTPTPSTTTSASPTPPSFNQPPSLSLLGPAASLFNLLLRPSVRYDARLLFAGGVSNYATALALFNVSDFEEHKVVSPITLVVSPVTVPGGLTEGCGPSTPLDQASFSLDLDTASSAYVAAAVPSAAGAWTRAACSLSISWPGPSVPASSVRLLLLAVAVQLNDNKKLSTDYNFFVNLTMKDSCSGGFRSCPAASSNNITASASVPAFTFRRSAPADASFVRCAPLPSSESADVLMVEGKDTAVFQCLSISSTTPEFSAGKVVLASGCSAADTLILPQAAVNAFSTATSGNAGALPAAGNYSGCPIVLPLTRVGSPAAYNALFSSILLSVSPSNDQPLLSALTGSPSPTDTGRRIVYFSVDISGAGTAGIAAVRVAVTPVNNPPLWPAAPVNRLVGSTASASSLLVEGTPPTLSVMIAQNCSSSGPVRARSASAASGAAVVCIEDPDPVAIAGGTALETAMTGGGGRSSTNGTALASRLPSGDETSVPLLTVGDYDLTLSLTSASLATPWVYPSPVLLTSSYVADCAGDTLAPTNATSARISTTGAADPFAVLTPCWRASYSLAPVPSFDRENATHPAWLLYSLTLTDSFTLDPASPTLTLTGSVNVSIADVDDPGTLAFVQPLSNATAKLRLDEAWGAAFSSPLSAQANEVLLDEATGQPVFGFEVPLRVRDADAGRTHAVLLEALSPLDGSDPLVLGRLLSQSLIVRRTRARAWDASLRTWEEGFSVLPTSAAVAATLASALLVKQLTVRACAIPEPVGGGTADGSNTGGLTSCPATASSLPLTLLIVRSNARVVPTAPTLSASVPESTPPGTILLSINASDADPGQSFSFLFSATGLPTWGPFLLRPTLTPYSTTDRATGAAVTLSLARSAELVVAQDALDFEDSTARSWAGRIVVSDDGRFPESSLLPPALPTSANITLTLTVTDVPDVPVVTTVDGIPEGGLSVWGGDVLELVGTGLGLPTGTASTVTATLVNGSLSFPLLGCVVVTRLTRVRCTTSPGYGESFVVRVTVSGQTSVVAVGAPPSHPRLSYQAPRVLSVSASSLLRALPGPGSDSSVPSGLLSIVGTGIPLSAPAGLVTASLADGARGGTGLFKFPLVNCSVAAAPGTDAPPGAAMLSCASPPGAGSGLHVVVDVGGRTSLPPLATFARPVLRRVVQGSAATVGSADPFAFMLEGTDLGEDAAALDWVEHAADPFLPSNTSCPATVGTYASCAIHRAQSCVHLLPFTRILCLLDPTGYGVGFAVRVSIRGQVSAWSSQTASRADETFLSYPPPVLSAVTFVESPTERPTVAATSGKTLLRLIGTGFASSYGATRVTIGGVPVLPMDGWAMPTATDATAAAAGTGASRTLILGSSNWTTALLVVAPPGLGTVAVVVKVGNRTSTSTLTYAPIVFPAGSFKAVDGAVGQRKTVSITGKGFAICGVCSNDPGALLNGRSTISGCEQLFGTNATLPTRPSDGKPDVASAIRSVCALPDAFRTDVSGPSAPLPAFELLLNDTNAGGVAAVEVFTIRSVAQFDTFLVVSLSMDLGVLSLTAGWQGGAANPLIQPFDFLSLLSEFNSIKDIQPPEWSADGGTVATLTIDNAYPTESVFVRPAGGAPTTGLASSFDGAFRCPLVWSTTFNPNPAPSGPGTAAFLFLRGGTVKLPDVNNTGKTDFDVATEWSLADERIRYMGWEKRVTFARLSATGSATYNPEWILLDQPLPCLITSWTTTDSRKSQSVVIRAPAWVGSAVVSLEGSASGYLVSYSQPRLTRVIDPPTGATNGSTVITIFGTSFGAAASLDGLWEVQNGAWHLTFAGRGSLYTLATPLFRHRVRFTYSDAPDGVDRFCEPILSWTTTTITCVTPSGIAGLKNAVTVELAVSAMATDPASPGRLFLKPGDVLVSTSAPANSIFSYNRPFLFSTSPDHGETVGGYPVRVTGIDFSSLNVSALYDAERAKLTAASGSSSSSSSSAWFPRVTILGATAPVTGAYLGLVRGTFSYSIDVSTDAAAQLSVTSNATDAGGADALLLQQQQSILSLNHTELVFVMPFFEGQVNVRLDLVSSSGTVIEASNKLLFVADPPRITAVTAKRPSASSFDFDPCLALNRSADESAGDSCVTATRAIYNRTEYPAFFTDPDAGTVSPCFRAIATTSLTLLEITGRGFGSGNAPREVQFVTVGGTPCTPLTGKTALIDDSTLRCEISQDIPRGRVDVEVGMAWRTVRSSDSSILPYAVCPCGFFADKDGDRCKACPDGASCAGALDKPRAKSGYWETDPAVWLQVRVRNVPLLKEASPFPTPHLPPPPFLPNPSLPPLRCATSASRRTASPPLCRAPSRSSAARTSSAATAPAAGCVSNAATASSGAWTARATSASRSRPRASRSPSDSSPCSSSLRGSSSASAPRRPSGRGTIASPCAGRAGTSRARRGMPSARLGAARTRVEEEQEGGASQAASSPPSRPSRAQSATSSAPSASAATLAASTRRILPTRRSSAAASAAGPAASGRARSRPRRRRRRRSAPRPSPRSPRPPSPSSSSSSRSARPSRPSRRTRSPRSSRPSPSMATPCSSPTCFGTSKSSATSASRPRPSSAPSRPTT
jgi:hypothetical protein